MSVDGNRGGGKLLLLLINTEPGRAPPNQPVTREEAADQAGCTLESPLADLWPLLRGDRGFAPTCQFCNERPGGCGVVLFSLKNDTLYEVNIAGSSKHMRCRLARLH